ncbi:bifunctional glutathione transferase/peroxidase [Saccharomyces pastorianus]|uniref:Bifunctional glutathione transferase/peroxidase n=1 Tax=Saccharomyces pastorianus TaxID=27292 RepID=A0A6C1EGT6_SACPS|nr:bifunctional glutathione transferase/peroxidase [Saccharomyces pastorianus]
MKSQLDFLEGETKKNNGYLVDDKLSGTDILISSPLQMAFERKFAKAEEYFVIAKWLETITSEDLYAVSKEKARALDT